MLNRKIRNLCEVIDFSEKVEIIGNITDNPELMEMV